MGWMVDVEFRQSPTHGMGVFARKPIKAGARVWRFDHSMKVSDLASLAALSPRELEFALHGGYLHHPSGKFIWYDDGMQYMNHASGEGANLGGSWSKLEEEHCVALRDIAAGEELFEDYAYWSLLGLHPDHWLRKLYIDFCPHHYEFLMQLSRERIAA